MMGCSKLKVAHGDHWVWGPPQHLCRPWAGHLLSNISSEAKKVADRLELPHQPPSAPKNVSCSQGRRLLMAICFRQLLSDVVGPQFHHQLRSLAAGTLGSWFYTKPALQNVNVTD